ncbi:hypothetical protein O181_116501, partial [Austropuccinia psidii MF-1]|nr:hypothetical protein [Austropuccinia psidii MF-1]
MPVQHSTPARDTRSQARIQAFPTPTTRAPLNGTPEVTQLRAHLERGPIIKGEAPFREEGRGTTFKSLGEDDSEEEENSVEEEGADGTEDTTAPEGASQGTGGPTLLKYNQPDPSLLPIMQKMTQIMANLQVASSSEALKPPECFDGTQPFKFRSFIQSFQLIFHNEKANFSEDKKIILYFTSFLTGR